jgi:imidazoleglycerol-phosphate dehydratase/histidinol-phosphatase
MKKVLFIDRDGTIIVEPPVTEQVDSLDQLEFLPGSITALSKLKNEGEYELVIVTNQDGLGTKSFPEEKFWPAHNMMLKILESEGVKFAEIHIDRAFPTDNTLTRKPGTGMLTKYFSNEYDLKNSFVIGDRITDIELAKNLGCNCISINLNKTIRNDLSPYLALKAENWTEIYNFLKLPPRIIRKERKTNETDIRIVLNLDGTGKTNIKTGVSFFDHMLDQIGKHSGVDLTIEAKGDTHVDEHHTIEDTGITLGEAFAAALGNKKGIERYGFCLPMDDCLAQVAIDFGGRNWIEWNVEFKREKIGDMPTEMFFHFFKSFSDGAKCNLNIKAEGDNEHHKIESIFKSLAKAIKMAVKRDADKMVLPSTKGSL